DHLHDRLGSEGLDFHYFGFGHCLRSLIVVEKKGRCRRRHRPTLALFYLEHEQCTRLEIVPRHDPWRGTSLTLFPALSRLSRLISSAASVPERRPGSGRWPGRRR